MTKKSNRLSPELLQAFADTHYIVHHEAPFLMHIGQPCPELKALMAEHTRVRQLTTKVVDSYRASFKLATTKGSSGRLVSVF
jgi:hypothetical protein